MQQDEILTVVKALIVRSSLNHDPSLSPERLKEIAQDVETRVKLETPISAIGLDSMDMTWLLVSLEEKLGVDASTISFFELYNVKDLIDKIISIKNNQPVETNA